MASISLIPDAQAPQSLFDRVKDTRYRPKLPDSLLIRRRGSRCLVIDTMKPDWFFCSVALIPLLKKLDGTRTIAEVIEENRKSSPIPEDVAEQFLRFVVDELYVVQVADFDANIRFEGMLLEMAYLQVTSQCNLDCRYCYRPTRQALDNELTVDEMKAVVAQVAAMNPRSTVVVTGGEPTVHRDIEEICAFIKDQGLRIEMNTNGILLPRRRDLLRTVDVFNVSLDGSRAEIHEFLRGRNTYRKTLRGIAFLEAASAQFVITPTYTSYNLGDLPSLMSQYCNVRCSFRSNVFIKMGKGRDAAELALTGNELRRATKRLPAAAQTEAAADFLPTRYRRKISCGMGVRYLSVEANGDVYPCQLMHDARFLMGNVRTAPLEEIYSGSEVARFCRAVNVNRLEGCADCTLKYLCGGGCRARALYEQGSVNGTDGLCSFWRDKYVDIVWRDAPD